MAITKTTTGYAITWYDADGHERQRTVKGISYQEAKRHERELLAQRDRGEARPDPRQVPTFAAFAVQWVEEHRGGWKRRTRRQYESVLKVHLLPRFGDRRLSAITEGDACTLQTALVDAGLSPSRVNLVGSVLHLVLEAAHRRGLLPRDPTAAVRRLRRGPSPIDPLDPDEIAAGLAAMPAWWRPYFVVAFGTGLRPAEQAGLRWGDLDRHRATLRVQRTRAEGHEEAPKTPGSARDVELLPHVLEALAAQRAQQAARRLQLGQGRPAPEQDYVFTGPNGGPIDRPTLDARVWLPAIRRAGLRHRPLYATRHSFASNALAAGEPPLWVAQQLGHGSLAMLARHYAKWFPQERAGGALAARLAPRSGIDRPVGEPSAGA